MKAVFPLLVFLSVSSAFARLGETLDECKARYGEVIRIENEFRPDYPQYCFQLGNIEIRVRLLNGRSGQEIFHGVDTAMTPSQIAEILNANRDAIDGQNSYSRESNILTISTAAFDKAFKAPGTGF